MWNLIWKQKKRQRQKRLLATLLGATGCAGALDDPEDLVLAHYQELFAVNLDFGATIFAKQHPVALFHVEGLSGAIFFVFALAGRNDLAFLRFLLGGIGNDDSPANLFSLFNATHDNAVV